jgi:hypothetical protein
MLTQVFFPRLFLWRWSFSLQFYHLRLNYWPLSFVIFSLFFLLVYPESWLVKLTQIRLFFSFILLKNGLFYWVLLLKFYFFIPISYRGSWVSQVRPGWLWFSSLILYFWNIFFVLSFDIKLLNLEVCNFF